MDRQTEGCRMRERKKHKEYKQKRDMDRQTEGCRMREKEKKQRIQAKERYEQTN